MLEQSIMRKKWTRFIPIVLWMSFFVYLLLQYQLVYLYYDDFGYCSLSYGYDAGIIGTDSNIYAMLKYLFHSYSLVNGRILTNFFLILAAHFGDLDFMRIMMPLCIVGIYLLIYRMLSAEIVNEMEKNSIVIFLIFSYGLFSIMVCNYGMYWFAAAFGYVIPTLLFLFFVNLFRTNGHTWVLPILAFFLCISCEQAIAMTVVYIVGEMILTGCSERKVLPHHIITLLCSAVGSVVMISSPASRGRMHNNTGQMLFFEGIVSHAERITKIFIDEMTPLFVFLMLSIFLIVGFKLVGVRKNMIVRGLHVLFLFATSVVISLIACHSLGGIDFDRTMYVVLLIYFVFAFFEMFFYYLKRDREKAILLLAVLSSVGLLLLMPEIPTRTFIPFIFVMIYFMCDIFLHLEFRLTKMMLVVLLVPYITINTKNVTMIYEGYQRNATVLEYNRLQLIEARDRLNAQQEVGQVMLYRLPDLLYAGQQVYYDDNLSWMKYGIDEYYDLPYEIEYIYRDYPTGDNPIQICPAKGLMAEDVE